MNTGSALLLVGLLLAVGPADAAIHMVRNTDADGDGSLREAVDDAEVGDTVQFASGVRGTITLEERLDVDRVNLKGPGANVVTVRGAGDGTVRITGPATISGLTLAGGDVTLDVAKGKVILLDGAVRDSSGAGIRIDAGHLQIIRSLVSSNAGPGVEAAEGSVTCVNSTVADNGGAGIRSEAGRIETANCTIAHNRGAGLQAGSGEATAHNTVLAANLRACEGTVTSKGYNLTDDPSCSFSQPGDVENSDPRVAPLAANGGPTETAALTGGSPAVEAGDPTGCADPTGGMLTVDQRGTRRPAGSRCDMGAFEQPVAVSGTVVNRIVALVDGDPITMYEVDTFTTTDPRLAEAARNNPAGVLELLVTQKVLAKEVAAQGISISDAEIDRYIENVRQRNNLSEPQLEGALSQQGLTMERYRAQIREELERAQLINREIRGKVSVSPEEIERYQKQQDGGGEEVAEGEESAEGEKEDQAAANNEQVSISHIVLQVPPEASEADAEAVLARAEKIHDELDDGADFAEVAKRESEDGVASQGGKLGTFKHGEMREELEQAVADLEPGEFSQPIRAGNSIHIVRLDERIGAESAPQLTDPAREEIKEKLYAQALEERYARWLKEDLRQRHTVEMLP
jgi:peptidyl-prolyl cis-trans isomerase SurA